MRSRVASDDQIASTSSLDAASISRIRTIAGCRSCRFVSAKVAVGKSTFAEA